jgi:hypothetical protein
VLVSFTLCVIMSRAVPIRRSRATIVERWNQSALAICHPPAIFCRTVNGLIGSTINRLWPPGARAASYPRIFASIRPAEIRDN